MPPGTRNIFDQSLDTFRIWKRGDPVTDTQHLNDVPEKLNKRSGVSPGSQVMPEVKGIASVGGGGGTIMVSIIATPADKLEQLDVQQLKWEGEDLVNDGAVRTVRTWPDLNNTDYTPFIGQPDIFDMVNLGGKLCVRHKVRKPMRSVPAGAVIGGCAS